MILFIMILLLAIVVAVYAIYRINKATKVRDPEPTHTPETLDELSHPAFITISTSESGKSFNHTGNPETCSRLCRRRGTCFPPRKLPR